MSETILCPQCEKRYSLPEHPPATFTCRQCGALVDLSAFGGKDRPASPQAAPQAAPSGTRARGRSSGRSSRSQARQPAQQRARPQENKPPVTAIIVVVLVVIVLIAARSGGDDDTEPTPPKTASKPAVSEPTFQPLPRNDVDRPGGRGKRTAKAKRKDDGSLKLPLSRVELKRLDWPEDVPPAIRGQADEAIRTMYVGGADGKRAEDWLVAQGRPIAGRLISEFVSIRESPGFDNRGGTSMAMQVDSLLHKIDGFIERACREEGKISSTGFYAGQSFITRTAKRWTWWWESGEWKSTPRKAWDPFEDESDETLGGLNKTESKTGDTGGGKSKKSDPNKGRGFGTRAGG